jgi:hypothetical protein
MSLIKFVDWLKMHDESTAFTRARIAAMKKISHPIPDADMLGGHSTNPWYNQFKAGTAWKVKKKKKKKKGK